MKINQYPMCGDYYAEPAINQTPPREYRPPLSGNPFFASRSAPPPAAAYSNIFNAPLTRRHMVRALYSMSDLRGLLASIREEAENIATAQVPGRRKHPREVVLAILQTTTAPRLTGRSVEKWAQRLRREGVIGYDRRVGWYLVARGPTPYMKILNRQIKRRNEGWAKAQAYARGCSLIRIRR